MDQPSSRMERDSMGQMPVPTWALWGASTQRAVLIFPVSGSPVHPALIHALGQLKAVCALVNLELGKLSSERARAIAAAADEVAQGQLDRHFPVDVYQTGSGTSTNMNANEVIANRVNQARNLPMGDRSFVHPNDHVNLGQSSNDTFPTAMHIAGALMLCDRLIPALERLHEVLQRHAQEWDDLVKIGRTHLMDATPIRMGQVFSGYAAQAAYSLRRAREALAELRTNLPIGGTAVGTGLNTHPEFGRRVCAKLSERSGVSFEEAGNHVEAQAAKDSFVAASGQLKTIAVSLSKIANDIRWLGSGPRCGLGELILPAIQPGSSIMPGKVNPVICESVMQVSVRVMANDLAITGAGLGGVGSLLELNVAMPVMAQAMLESIELLAGASRVLVDHLLEGLQADRQRCAAVIEQSLMMVTSLAPALGYDAAAKLAKQALEQGTTIRALVREKKLMDEATLDRLLDPRSMTEPGGEGVAGG